MKYDSTDKSITISGDILEYDFPKFLITVFNNDVEKIKLSSYGGDFGAASYIMKYVEEMQYDTETLQNTYCISSCAYIWMVGRNRYKGWNSTIEFHSVYYVDTEEIAWEAMVDVAYMVGRLGFNEAMLAELAYIGADTTLELTPEKANLWGITYEEKAPITK